MTSASDGDAATSATHRIGTPTSAKNIAAQINRTQQLADYTTSSNVWKEIGNKTYCAVAQILRTDKCYHATAVCGQNALAAEQNYQNMTSPCGDAARSATHRIGNLQPHRTLLHKFGNSATCRLQSFSSNMWKQIDNNTFCAVTLFLRNLKRYCRVGKTRWQLSRTNRIRHPHIMEMLQDRHHTESEFLQLRRIMLHKFEKSATCILHNSEQCMRTDCRQHIPCGKTFVKELRALPRYCCVGKMRRQLSRTNRVWYPHVMEVAQDQQHTESECL